MPPLTRLGMHMPRLHMPRLHKEQLDKCMERLDRRRLHKEQLDKRMERLEQRMERVKAEQAEAAWQRKRHTKLVLKVSYAQFLQQSMTPNDATS